MKTFAFDVDKTICQTFGNDYPHSIPNYNVIKLINKLYEDGNVIKIFTSRGMKSGIDWKELTLKQLDAWGVNYTELIMTKPSYDVIVDDKARSLYELGCVDEKLVNDIVRCYREGGKVLTCGNGGFAGDSEHFTAELVGKFAYDVYIPCISLTTNTSLVTALSNDLGYEYVFAHQVSIMGQRGDIFIGMTTSQSKNIVKACEVAKNLGLTTVMVCGEKSEVKADYIHRMIGADTAIIQNNAIQFLHGLAYAIKRQVWSEDITNANRESAKV